MRYSQITILLLVVYFQSFTLDQCLASESIAVQSTRPLIGTAAHGHTYPGATVPFGMVQLSPDTRLDTWDGCSGYHYSDKAILGFSHTHLSGTGCGDLGDIRVTPRIGSLPPATSTTEQAPCRFSHSNETAKPGYYSVLLDDSNIKVELTATTHTGFHRYTFPANQPPCLEFDLARGIACKTEEVLGNAIQSEVEIKTDTVIQGYRHSKGWAANKTYYFVAEFSRPFTKSVITVEDKQVDCSNAKGRHVFVRTDFEPSKKPILLKIGISAVSVEAARKNLHSEIPTWDFDATVTATQQMWGDFLGRIEIQTKDPAVRETFYTALYHTGMAPTLFNDIDGSYCGLDHKVHVAPNFQNYCTFSLWDTFRAEHPLLTLVQPQRVDDFVNSMLAHYRDFNQHSLPVWSLAGNETWCMIGNHSIPVIVDAYLKGFRGFDAEAVYEAIRDTSMQDRNLLNEYRKFGFIPSNLNRQSVSRTLEYAYDDWCVAQMAKALGKTEDAKLFTERSRYYQNVFDSAVKFMRGKFTDGNWHVPQQDFDPSDSTWNDFTEGTSWNYTWFVPQDIPGLIKLIGGDAACVAKLDKMFNEDVNLLAHSPDPDLTGLIGQYIHGNEPCHHVSYLYCYAGAPWKTQERVRQIMANLYSNAPDGLCGNDDCGQMSAWYVFSALGFYPVNPASGVYVLGSPLVDQAIIRLDPKCHKGKTFTIIAKNNSPKNVFIQAATLNGKPLTRPWLTHAEITDGGKLILSMGAKPNKKWGQSLEARPPIIAPER